MFGTDLYTQLMLINKILASELRRKFFKSALLVGAAHRDSLLLFSLQLKDGKKRKSHFSLWEEV